MGKVFFMFSFGTVHFSIKDNLPSIGGGEQIQSSVVTEM